MNEYNEYKNQLLASGYPICFADFELWFGQDLDALKEVTSPWNV